VSLLELIFVVASVIVGLGVAEVLTGVVRILRGELKAGLAQGLWTLTVFLFLVQLVWAYWDLNAEASLTYAEYLIILWGPIALFISASLLFPKEGDHTKRHLDDYLIEHRVVFLLSVFAFLVQAQVANWTLDALSGRDDLALILRLVVAGLILSGFLTRNRWWHRGIPALVLAISLYFTAQITPVAGLP
jgi:uncharacterized membrane protein